MLRSILVGLDGSLHSRAALELAIRWAHRYDALLIGVGIVDEPTICRAQSVPIGAGGFKRERDLRLLTEAQKRVDQFLAHFVSWCARESVNYKVVHAVGTPAAQILEQSHRCDLIMLGQETYFHFETQDWNDDTLEQVVRRCMPPVVSVPKLSPHSSRVLVAYDGGPQSHRALQMFQALRLAEEKDVHIVSADASADTAERTVREAIEFLQWHEISAVARPIVSIRPASEVILAQVEELKPALLVAGAYGRSRLREFVFGSTTSHILRGSRVPVFLCS